MLTVDYRGTDRRALISWSLLDNSSPWVDTIRRLIFDSSSDATQEDAYTITLPWWGFVALRGQFHSICRSHHLKPNSGLNVTPAAITLLQNSKKSESSYRKSIAGERVSKNELLEKLNSVGFARQLTERQLENVRLLASLPSAATFSVPGAGKTTEALATFFYRANFAELLLVIAPKNAFAAWDEQIQECMPQLNATFTRLRGGRDKIVRMLEESPRFMLITYQQLTRVGDLLAAHCAEHDTFIYLDESHRIKSGVSKLTARSVLDLAHLPVGKLLMSGTPMPQSIDDLLPQFAFLYSEIPATSDNVLELIKPIYVRTNKAQLGLPPLSRQRVSLPMAPLQFELYKLMKFEVAREAAVALSTGNKQGLRHLGKSVARILQFISNPALLSTELNFLHPDLLSAVLTEGDGPKIRYLLKRTRQLAREGHKILIWSSFVRNVEYLADRLSDLGAVYIHGGVDAGDEDDDESREGKIKLFHDSPNVRVLVANPAAASEGISLHTVCHHAIYLDRTFNAAHYLQSEDRIHRYGLPANQMTTVEILECANSVDETVRTRLNFKISQMAEALEDSSLRPDPIALDPNEIEDFEEYSTGLSSDDIRALLADIGEE